MPTREQGEYDWYFRACFAPVARTVFLIVHNRAQAEDITQEALYRMLKHWRTVSTYERPEAWVRRVAIRIAVREVQRASVRPAKERLAQIRRRTMPCPTPTSHVRLPRLRPCSVRPSSSSIGRTGR